VNARMRFMAAAVLMLGAASPLSGQQSSTARADDLSKYPVILSVKSYGLPAASPEAVLDRYAKITGDVCPASIHAALKKAGLRAILHDSTLGSVFTLNGSLRPDALSGLNVGGAAPSSVSEIELNVQPWWPILSIRNAAHYAKVMFSEPWKRLQKKEMDGGAVSAVSWGYVRAALTAGNIKPVVKPEDLGGAGDDWTKLTLFDYLFNNRSPNEGKEVAKILGQMCDMFDCPTPLQRSPSADFEYATSHQLATNTAHLERESTRFVSLTTGNILVDAFAFHRGKSVPAEMSGTIQAMLDQVAVECSKANSVAELNELNQLRSSRTVNPVDLDAFQRKRRSVIEKFPSELELNLFDEIQALN